MKIERFWSKRGILNYCLLPFATAYRLSMALRRQFYKHQFKKSYKFVTPVIIVGNISVGGTGKTPLVSAIATWLKQHGYKPGIVSRGYKGKAKHWPLWVDKDSNPELVGDEAVMLAQQTGCPTVVGPDRVDAVSTLLASNDCDIVLSDDGLQHYALDRQMEIVVMDGNERHHNGFCLPAGPLREPIDRVDEADFIVTNGAQYPQQGEYNMQVVAGELCQVMHADNKVKPAELRGCDVHAVAGIGHPQRFFKTLEQLGIEFTRHEFADHHVFSAADVDFGKDAIVIMTEKDAVKCSGFATERMLCLPVRATLDQEFFAQFEKKLHRL